MSMTYGYVFAALIGLLFAGVFILWIMYLEQERYVKIIIQLLFKHLEINLMDDDEIIEEVEKKGNFKDV